MQTETLTFLFTDIEGSTSLLERVGHDAYARVLSDHHGLIRREISGHGGREIDTQGDGFFAVFSSASACAAAVIQMQLALGAHEWAEGERVQVRMGVHSGEASEATTGLVGLEVHRAARVAAVAYGGQILLSESAAVLARDSLPAGASLKDLGLHRLKDLGRPQQLFQLVAGGLRPEFPPLRSLDNPALPNNLPAQSATFVGRDRELGELRGLVECSRLVTLTGAGGSGKTRLALQVAAELLDGSGDGVWLVELASLSDGEAVDSGIARTLGIVVQPGRPALDSVLDALGPQRTLVVLDNCEHLIDACAKVAEAILRKCPSVHLLATSREPLGISGERIYRVPSLSLPRSEAIGLTEESDAVALFVERVRAQGVGLALVVDTTPLVVSICRRLDGMPLAIELAAARMRSMSLTSLSERLDQRFRLLTGGSRSALPRQQTLQATVQWSYSLLSGAEQALLRRLSVFVDGFELEAAERVCALGDIEIFDVDDLLGSLVDKSLVVVEPVGEAVRYRLLETIRQFAVDRLVEHSEDEATAIAAAHCEHFLAVAETAAPHLTGPDQGRWLARLDAEQSNLRRAIEHAASALDQTIVVLRFAVALRRYLWVPSRGGEIMTILLPVLQRPEARTQPQLLAGALVTAARLASFVDVHNAQRLGERAVEIARQLDDDRLLVSTLRMLSGAHYFAGDVERGFPLANECVERARPLGDDVVLAESLTALLLYRDVLGPSETDELFLEALACVERSGDRFQTVMLRNNAAVHALDTGDVQVARMHLEQASQVSEAIGVTTFNVQGNLGMVLREEGDLDGATAMVQDGLRISRRRGDRYGLAYSMLCMAFIATDLGDWQRAAELHGVAQAFLDQIGQPWLFVYKRFRQRSIDTISVCLGKEELERCYAKGRGLGFDAAIELALSAGTHQQASQVDPAREIVPESVDAA